MASSKTKDPTCPTTSISYAGTPTAKPVSLPQLAQWYGSLEIFRGLAALLIVVYHVYQNMRSGSDSTYPLENTHWHVWLVSLDNIVGLFFVLSAFLLGLPYMRAALDDTPLGPSTSFLFRRAVRIVPLNTIAILTIWSVRTEQFPGDWLDLVEHLTFTQVFDNQRIFYTIGPAWSVAVEVHFYILLATLGPIACKHTQKLATREQRTQVLTKGLILVGLTSLLSKIGANLIGVDETNWVVWFSLLAKLDIFVCGLLLAVFVATRREKFTLQQTTRRVVVATGVAVLLLGVSAQAFVPLPTYSYQHTVTAIGFAFLLAASVATPQASTSSATGSYVASSRWHPLRQRIASSGSTVGLVSYSLYLWHEPLMLYLADKGWFPTPGTPTAFPLGVLIILPASIAVAWISYWTIEYPTSMIKRTRWRGGGSREYYP